MKSIMTSWKSSFRFILTASAVVVGSDLLKMSANTLFESLPVHIAALKTPIAAAAAVFFVLIFPKFHAFGQSKGVDFTHEHIGISIALSAAFLTIRSFYLSFSDFERSLSCIYAAFFLFVIAVFVIFGRTGTPSSAVILAASYLSLLFAFLGLALMLTPHMLNPALLVSFTATFALVISFVLLVIHTLRSDEILTGIPFDDRKGKMDFAEMVEHLESVDEAEEAFVDQDSRKCGECEPESGGADETFFVVEDLFNHLNEYLKSIDDCVNFFASNGKELDRSRKSSSA